MKQPSLSYILVIIIGLSQCQRESCYRLDIQFSNDAKIQLEDPVFYEDGVVGEIVQLKKESNFVVATVCINDSTTIPTNSVINSGYLRPFGNYGITIVPGQDNMFAQPGALLKGATTDSIDISFSHIRRSSRRQLKHCKI